MQIRILACVCVFVAGSALQLPTVKADDTESKQTLAEVIRQISAAWDKHSSLSLDIRATIESAGANRVVEQAGKVHVLKKDGKEFYRRELMTTTTFGGSGVYRRDVINTLDTSDGETAHRLANIEGDSRVYKFDPAQVQRVAGKPLIDQLRANGELTLVPPPPNESRDDVVIKVKLANPTPPADTLLVHIDPETGVTSRQTLLGSDGAEIQMVEFVNLRLDIPIDEKQFEFVQPEGVEVVDHTNDGASKDSDAKKSD